MSLGLDDRLLGEKVENYCSSDEGEQEEDEDDASSCDEVEQQAENSGPTIPEPSSQPYSGHSTKTGPKGVMNDWRRYKQLENEKKAEQEQERLGLAKKLTLTCRSHLDDEAEKSKDQQFLEDIEKELGEFEDEFIREYRKKRIEEMRHAVESLPRFGRVIKLQKDQYIDSIDQENPAVTIIVHIYENNVKACEAMSGCLQCLAQEYPTVKFCDIRASDTKLSGKFAVSGVPALLVYKNKDLIGNFVGLSRELGDDFFATDVESFLLEHCLLPDKSLQLNIIRSRAAPQSDSDSDFDVD